MQDSLATAGKPSTAMDVAAFFERSGTKFANQDTTMKLGGLRLHVRILRRLSMAVLDPADPKYEFSALYYMDRNEEIFGRTSQQMTMQESNRIFDSFCSALADLSDLRLACEALHILLLRGFPVKISARTVTETARVLPLYSKIPQASFL